MSETKHRWTGETIAGRYLLGRHLGGSEHNAVFLTEIVHARPQKVAIKLIPAAGADVDRQLARWKSVSALSHENLLKILDYGKCELDGAGYLYVVMEYADEDLSQILPQRSLSADETRAMIEPVVAALAFLHEKNLVHTRVHPGNVLAMGDQIKLSSDAISPAGEPLSFTDSAGLFSPPEWGKGIAGVAEDVWSLGATIVAALTQQAPAPGQDGEISLPAELAEPFSGIARESLKKDPSQRVTIEAIRGKLNPSSVPVAPAAKEPAKVDPLAVPLSKVSPSPVATRPAPIAPTRVVRPSAGAPRPYLLPVAVAATLAILLFALPRLLHHQPEAATASASKNSTKTPARTNIESRPASVTTPVSAPAPKKSAPAPISKTENAVPVVVPPAPPVKAVSKPSEGVATRGEVLDQVLPEISQKARDTIQGTVRLSIRMRVNATGTVDSADLETPSGSRYFADQAIKAAKRWQFSAPEIAGRSVDSEWVVRFEFTPSTTSARPTQVSP